MSERGLSRREVLTGAGVSGAALIVRPPMTWVNPDPMPEAIASITELADWILERHRTISEFRQGLEEILEAQEQIRKVVVAVMENTRR